MPEYNRNRGGIHGGRAHIRSGVGDDVGRDLIPRRRHLRRSRSSGRRDPRGCCRADRRTDG